MSNFYAVITLTSIGVGLCGSVAAMHYNQTGSLLYPVTFFVIVSFGTLLLYKMLKNYGVIK